MGGVEGTNALEVVLFELFLVCNPLALFLIETAPAGFEPATTCGLLLESRF
jgi:hypothetical protein